MRPHPNAHRIRLAQVDLGVGEPVQIVFGGPPIVRRGDLVPVAPPGSCLPGPNKMNKMRRRRYRGESSHGMMCSLAELGWKPDAPDEVARLRDVIPGDSLDNVTTTDWESLVINATNTFGLNAVRDAQLLPSTTQVPVTKRTVASIVVRPTTVNGGAPTGAAEEEPTPAVCVDTGQPQSESLVVIRNAIGPITQRPLIHINRSQSRDADSETASSRSVDVSHGYHGIGVERVSYPSAGRMAAEVAGKAFQHDPMWRYVLPDNGHRARVLPAVLPLDYAQRYGEIWVTSSLVYGVAGWLPPGDTAMTYWRLLRVGALRRALHLGPRAFGRFLRLEGSLEEQHCRDVTQPHWYLLLLAVDPSRQGSGVGGQLMAPVLEKAGAVGMPVYLQTLHERNVPFYQRHGFRVTSETVPSRGEPPCWGMILP